jgi:hypothetical protein
MIDLKLYLDKIINLFKEEHVLFFIIIVVSLLILDYFIFSKLNIKLFSPLSIISAYCFINLKTSVYKLITGSIIGTLFSYFVYEIFTVSFNKINVVLLNLVSFTSVITGMILLNCIFIPALAYSLASYEIITKSAFSYLTSLISSNIIIVILCTLLLNIIKYIYKNSPNIITIYQQLITNLSNK